MGRPRKNQGRVDFQRRIRAYEMYAGGLRKAEIAGNLGVSRMTITNWSKEDRWDERLGSVVNRAEDAVDFELGNAVASTVATLKERLKRRIDELEGLCSVATQPGTRLQAIKLWLQMAGVDKGLDLGKPITEKAGSLAFVKDLMQAEGTVPKEVLDELS